MLKGFYKLSDSELEAFTKEAELKCADRESNIKVLLKWVAGLLRVSDGDRDKLERAVVRWTAEKLDVPLKEDMDRDAIEAAVRRKIADDSASFLFPFLEVSSAVAYIGPRRVVGPKLEMLEAASAGVIPSHSAREKLRKYWTERGEKIMAQQDQLSAADLIAHLEEPLAVLRECSESTRLAVLILSYVVALSDGRFEAPEEEYSLALISALGVEGAAAERAYEQVSSTFWKELTAIGGGVENNRATEEELVLTLQAAQATLQKTGGISSMGNLMEQGFVASLHRSIQADSPIRRGIREGQTMPFRFPLGFATGMMCYIRERWNADEHEILLRLSLAAIYQQHLEASESNTRVSIEEIKDHMPDREVENHNESLAKTTTRATNDRPSKKISLDRLTFQNPTNS